MLFSITLISIKILIYLNLVQRKIGDLIILYVERKFLIKQYIYNAIERVRFKSLNLWSKT